MNQKLTSPYAVDAHYTEQRLPQFKGNPLIEALPQSMTDQGLVEALMLMPDFTPEQREWDTSERVMMLETLANFMVPLQRHTEVCRALDGMLRSGYVGRVPHTPGHSAIFQSIYQKQMTGKTFAQSADSRTPQLSTALIGISGMGKSTTVQRWCAHLPKVIFHSKYNLYQIPVLHIEMPSDGSSIKGLAHGILHKIDELIPGANYYDMYAQRGRTGADTLMRGVARVMNLHLVGLLICDELQNLANSSKGSQTVMTELVSAANDLKVPIFFIGTNKAVKVLGVDFRQARRSTGHGIAPWGRLIPGAAHQPSEWDVFIDILWQFQWLRKPVKLDALLSKTMFDCSQGVIDLAIKLFAAAQARAMLDGSETITAALLLDVYNKEFQLMHPMVDALREDNFEILSKYDDIAPLNLHQHIEDAKRKVKALKSPLYSVKAGDETFSSRLCSGLEAIGVGTAEAMTIAEQVATDNPDADLANGLKQAVQVVTKPPPLNSRAKGKATTTLPTNRFDERPGDYRRAFAHAPGNKLTVLRQLKDFGMAPQLEVILNI